MPTVSPQNRLERVVPALLGLTVLSFAAGSSSVASVTRVAHGARWAVLLLLFVSAAAWAGRRALETPPRVPTVAAALLVGLALLSTLWSVAPRLSFERGVSLGLLLGCGLLLSIAAGQRAGRSERLLVGLLGGMAAVGIAGLLVFVLAHGDAVVARSYETPERFKGLGQNPNTSALLFALGVPLAVWALLTVRSRGWRLAAAGVLVLLAGSIAASGSRGSLLAAALGALVPAVAAPQTWRRRALAVAAVALAALACGVVQQLPKASSIHATGTPQQGHKPHARPRYFNAEAVYPLNADIGGPLPGGGQPTITRSFLSSSGRVQAWEGALRQAAQRPLLGYGFGTEASVFVDRYYTFVAALPENSYIGMALQLGAVGVLALLGLVAVLALPARRALAGPRRIVVGACLGTLVAGLVLAVVQSYVYAAGNIAAATFWICAFLVPVAAHE